MTCYQRVGARLALMLKRSSVQPSVASATSRIAMASPCSRTVTMKACSRPLLAEASSPTLARAAWPPGPDVGAAAQLVPRWPARTAGIARGRDAQVWEAGRAAPAREAGRVPGPRKLEGGLPKGAGGPRRCAGSPSARAPNGRGRREERARENGTRAFLPWKGAVRSRSRARGARACRPGRSRGAAPDRGQLLNAANPRPSKVSAILVAFA